MNDKPGQTDDPLETPVQYVRGVGPQRAGLLAKLGCRTVEDLLWNVPRDLLDLSDVRPVGELEAGNVQTVRGTVVDVDARLTSKGGTLTAVLFDCDGEYVRGVWFNQPWIRNKFQSGQSVMLSEKPKRRHGRWEFSHPRVQWIEDDDVHARGEVLPRYGLTEGLRMHEMRRITRNAVSDYVEYVTDVLPANFRDSRRLLNLRQAIRQLHIPAHHDQFEAARRRLIYDDFLAFELGLAMRRRVRLCNSRASELPTTTKIDARIRRLFPFQFTAGQNEAVQEICADLASGRAMHRLLQADVGAGKTAVALYAMLVAVAAGHQAVLMAPTEVLARQHWAAVERILGHSRVERLLLTGNLTSRERKQALADVESGRAQLIVGTQAVIQQDVRFDKLALVVIDEQHKFGVAQRAWFSSGEASPHVLVMTATPIPRSMCLTQYGDLDMSVVTDMPPGRQSVTTSRVVGESARKRVWEFVRKQLHTGRQAYVVCPQIESQAEPLDTNLPASAEDVYQQLSTGELSGVSVGLAYGQMDRREKADVMHAFRQRSIQVLVATTVVEVGVDIPNANLMVVYQAQQFGLAQLHQLRGRIGRGKFRGYCFLFSDTPSEEANRRLAAMEATADGFQIAELDYQLRGPGDVLGTRQHGGLPLKVADPVRDQELLLEAREAAFQLVETSEIDEPAFAPLKVQVLERFGRLMELPQSG